MSDIPLPEHGQKQAFSEVALSPEWKKLADHTVTGLLVHANWFAQIMYKVLRWVVTRDVAVAATDERSIFVNPDDYFKREIGHRIFILCHEIMHVVLWHCSLGYKWHQQGFVLMPDGRRVPYNDKIMNIAMDYVINAMLIKCGLDAPDDALYDPALSCEGMEAVLQVYDKLYQHTAGPGGGGLGQGKTRAKTKRGDTTDNINMDVMKPGSGSGEPLQQETKEEEERRHMELKVVVAQATQSCKQAGKMPAALMTLIQELLEPVVEWPESLAAVATRQLGNDGYDWKSVDRRLILRNIGGPRMSEFRCGPLVFVGDSSGSITDPLAARFFSECAGVFDQVRPEKVYFIWCDAQIQAAHELEDVEDLKHIMPLGVPGRGGTSFIPPFEWIEENGVEPDMVIYLTDGYGRFPSDSKWPVIWAMITDVQPPFGEIVRVPADAC